jgi:hypothetical protein
MRRVLILWSVAVALLIGAFAVTVVVLNSTLYSASGFVDSYLSALARQDATSASDLPGVLASEDSAANLLTDEALGDLSNVEFIDDHVDSNGVHLISYGYTMNGVEGESDFRVSQTASFLGLFHTWTFETSPLATVAVTVLHDDRFRVNGIEVDEADQPIESGGFLVFAPGLYSFDHKSTYLAADAIEAPITEPGSVTAVQVNVQANANFVSAVDKELRDYLDTCATQEVLLPTGCPFGKSFENRIDTTPKWSIASYPPVEIVPGENEGEWIMPQGDAAAHLSVEVQSLFDGSRSQFDEDVPFTVSYSVGISETDQLSIKALFG